MFHVAIVLEVMSHVTEPHVALLVLGLEPSWCDTRFQIPGMPGLLKFGKLLWIRPLFE